MEMLIDNMLNLGADRGNLHAKLFGGGSMFKPFDECRLEEICIGNENILFIREFIKIYKIKTASEDLGGDTGRIIRFYSDDFAVYVKKIKRAANLKIICKDKALWNRIKESGNMFKNIYKK